MCSCAGKFIDVLLEQHFQSLEYVNHQEREIMDKNLLQLNYSFYNVCVKLIKQSTFEMDVENSTSLTKYLYLCGKFADLLRE